LSKRWITVLGRAGTVLMAAGLALVLLSMIPARKVDQSDFFGVAILEPQTFIIDPTYIFEPLTPQQGLYLNIRANCSVTAYVLNLGKENVYQWILARFPESQPSSALNGSILDEFLNVHPNSVAQCEDAVGETTELQHVPSRLMNVTVIFSNRGTQTASVSYRGKLLNYIVPGERALNPAKFAVPVGLVLAVPWLLSTRKRMAAKPPSIVVQASSATAQKSRKARTQ